MSGRFALIVGNDHYTDPTLAQLVAPEADIAALAGVLRDLELGAFDDVQVLYNESQSMVRREIARFFHDREPDDLLLLYFSGHGILDEEGQLYLATPDTERQLLDATAVAAHYINRLIRRSRSRRQVLILDCCHSGAFDRSAKGSGLGTEVGIGEAFAGDGTGHIVLAASKATEYAFEGDQVLGAARSSVFTGALVEGIRTGDADLDEDGRITPEELYDYAYRRVRIESPGQTPGKWAYEQTGDLTLARSPRRRLPIEIQEQLVAGDPLIRFRVIDGLAALSRGSDLTLGRLASEALERLAGSDDSLTIRRAAVIALGDGRLSAPTLSASEEMRGASPPAEPRRSGAQRQESLAAYSAPPLPQAPHSQQRRLWQNAAIPAMPLRSLTSQRLWRQTLPVALAWCLVAGLAQVIAYRIGYNTDNFESSLLWAVLGVALAAAYTVRALLRPPPSLTMLAGYGLLALVPLAGPASYSHLLFKRLAPIMPDRQQRTIAAAGYGVLLQVAQSLLLWSGYSYVYTSDWWTFDRVDVFVTVPFVFYGVAIFLGAQFAVGERDPVRR